MVIEDWTEEAIVRRDEKRNAEVSAQSTDKVVLGLKRLLQEPVDAEIEAEARRRWKLASELDKTNRGTSIEMYFRRLENDFRIAFFLESDFFKIVIRQN